MPQNSGDAQEKGNFQAMQCLADPAKARGCSINSLVINSLTDKVSRHAQTVRDSTSTYRIDYVIVINFPNPKGHQNPISGSKVTAFY